MGPSTATSGFDRRNRTQRQMKPRFFEDFKKGDRLVTHGVTVTESHMLDFAQKYDPQVIHMDQVGAEQLPVGGIIASGWLTAALAFRQVVQTGFLHGGGVVSPGLTDMKFLRPVRPGDTITAIADVIEAKPTPNGSRGVVDILYTVNNQRGETVLSWLGRQLVALRPRGAA